MPAIPVPAEHQKALQKVADKMAAAQPKTPSAAISIIMGLLPFFPAALSVILERVNSPKTNAVLIQIRDTLVNADLGD